MWVRVCVPWTYTLNGHRCVSLTLAGWPILLSWNLMSCRGRDNTSCGGSIFSTLQYSVLLSQTQRECTCLEVWLWHKACREPDVSEANAELMLPLCFFHTCKKISRKPIDFNLKTHYASLLSFPLKQTLVVQKSK